jgi:hypothetical protein
MAAFAQYLPLPVTTDFYHLPCSNPLVCRFWVFLCFMIFLVGLLSDLSNSVVVGRRVLHCLPIVSGLDWTPFLQWVYFYVPKSPGTDHFQFHLLYVSTSLPILQQILPFCPGLLTRCSKPQFCKVSKSLRDNPEFHFWQNDLFSWLISISFCCLVSYLRHVLH